ncbi:MAG: hypothetical protein WCT53_03105 [Candidatus Gracilibacteria bacterium]|jgi:hypothetical protein
MDDQFQQAQQSGGSSMPPPPPGQGGAFDPMAAPDGGQTPPPPPKPSKPANFQLGALLPPQLKVKVPPHNLQFEEQYFLHLLAGSISLTRDEKARIVESIPKLKQTQVDELIRIFEEERRKFAELGEEHIPQLEKLAKQHFEDWVDIEVKQQQTSQADDDKKKAEELRKQLGL